MKERTWKGGKSREGGKDVLDERLKTERYRRERDEKEGRKEGGIEGSRSRRKTKKNRGEGTRRKKGKRNVKKEAEV